MSLTRPVCPHSAFHADLTTDYVLHYATERELAANGGVCAACARTMRKAHGRAISTGTDPELPGRPSRRISNSEEDHAGLDRDGAVIQTVDFDYEAVDAALGLVKSASPTARAEAGELVRELISYCFAGKRGRTSLRTAAGRFAVIAGGLRPDLLEDATMTELAAELGLSKAALSKMAVNFSDEYQVKFSRSRSAEARASMRAARLGGPDRTKLGAR